MTLPSTFTTRFQICGFISLPWFATAAAIIASCSGVTRSRSWPIATRATSTGSFLPSSVEPSKTPLLETSSSGRSIGGVALKPNFSIIEKSFAWPTFWPSWANQVLTELVKAVSSEIEPQSCSKSLAST